MRRSVTIFGALALMVCGAVFFAFNQRSRPVPDVKVREVQEVSHADATVVTSPASRLDDQTASGAESQTPAEVEDEWQLKIEKDWKDRIALMSPPPSPGESEAIMKAKRVWIQTLREAKAEGDNESPDAAWERHERYQAAEDELGRVLGEARYAEYKRVTQHGYAELYPLKIQLDLSPTRWERLLKLHDEVVKDAASGRLAGGREGLERARRYREAIIAIIGEENFEDLRPDLFLGVPRKHRLRR
jgi:hypothetical protein